MQLVSEIGRNAAGPVSRQFGFGMGTTSSVNGNSRKVVVHKYKFNYSKSTRTNSKCTCEVCGAAQLKYGKNLPGTVPRKENQRNSKPSNLNTTKVIREVIRMCNTCLTEIGRGKNHVCTVTERSENLANLSKFLAEKVSTSGSENIRLSNRRGKPSVFLKANSTVSLKERKRMRTEDMFKVKTENNLSMRKTLRIMKSLKRGGVSFETGLKGKLSKLNSQLGDLFSIVELGEVHGLKKSKLKCSFLAENVHLGQCADVPVIFCNNISELLQRIKKSRHTSEEELFIKLGIDGGGGFFKITLSVVSKTQNNSTDDFKDSGVKRLHFLALAPNLAEKYEYIFLTWNGLLKLNPLESIIAGDLKTINVIIGIMAHSSTHPCPYCFGIGNSTVKSFKETQTTHRRAGSGRKAKTNNPVNARKVRDFFKRNPNLSVAKKVNSSVWSVQHTMKRAGLQVFKKLYHEWLVQPKCIVMNNETYIKADAKQIPGLAPSTAKYIKKNASRSASGPTKVKLCLGRIWHRAITRNR
ncbi:uncharacterized protein LOC135708811 [Ochlerotatus camptorhynchus]|uniref:uncharacterized protein LOC135708811 n=1 Tax=Ochlerotatus camptorhynchus TaxID=644619 RepID=UPI0031DA8171